MKGRVLVVDDNVNERIIAETLLRARGFRVRTAADGTEACDIMSREGADMVISDLALPGMNGWELIRRLRGRFEPMPPPSQPRIVVTAGKLEPETKRFALRLGADAVLAKPLVPREFLDTVERLLEQANSATQVAS